MLDAFHFSWDKFETNLKQSYAGLREAPDFSDVTLVCADGEQVEAHKVILASASPFFFNMLHMDKHPHPRIYMKGLTLTKLSYIVDFIYHGEVSVGIQDISEFLELAEELKLKGMSKTDDLETEETDKDGTSENIFTAFNGVSDQKMEIQGNDKLDGELVSYQCKYCNFKCNAKPILRAHTGRSHIQIKKPEEQINENDDEELKTGVEIIKLEPISGKNEKEILTKKMACNFCLKRFNTKSALKMHIWRKHKEDKSEVKENLGYKCKFCPTMSKSKGARYSHVYKKHSASGLLKQTMSVE